MCDFSNGNVKSPAPEQLNPWNCWSHFCMNISNFCLLHWYFQGIHRTCDTILNINSVPVCGRSKISKTVGTNPKGANLLFDQIFPKTAQQSRKLDRRRQGHFNPAWITCCERFKVVNRMSLKFLFDNLKVIENLYNVETGGRFCLNPRTLTNRCLNSSLKNLRNLWNHDADTH